MRLAPRLYQRARGFTLLELLVVMTIIAIAFFAVRPGFVRSLQSDRERSALRAVMALLSSARTEAIARGRLVRIAIAPGQTVLSAELQAESDYGQSSSQAGTATPWGEDYRSQFAPVALMGRTQVRVPSYLRITQLLIGGAEGAEDNAQLIYFFPDGRTSGAQLILTGDTGQQFVVELSPATGEVSLRA